MQVDYLVIGGGIMGLATARALRARHTSASIVLIEKEPGIAAHASGRNSGVLHAGFYYAADSLKARFCHEGNAALKAYAHHNGLRLNACGKVVVAKNESELAGLHELKRRGDANGVNLRLVNEEELAELEPYARTHKEALFSPSTAVVDPQEVCDALAAELREDGVEILLAHPYHGRLDERTVEAGSSAIRAGKIFNCAGLYADRIARDFGFCHDYAILPFKGVYLQYDGTDCPVTRCIYPVPDMKNPFLGVHFGVRVDGVARIGPTAIPALWRENYHGMEGFDMGELFAIAGWEMRLLATNAAFRAVALREVQKYRSGYMAASAGRMAQGVDMARFSQWSRPGIRAQLVDKRSATLVQDFIVEGDGASAHVLNAVSPSFTCSLPFAEWLVEKYA